MEQGPVESQPLAQAIVKCSHCGQLNRVLAMHKSRGFRCGSCRTPLANPFPPDNRLSSCPQSHLWASAAFRLLLVGLVVLVVLGLRAMKDRGELAQLRKAFRAKVEKMEIENQQRKEQEDKVHKAMLLDSDLILGYKARRAHEEEWEKRLAHAAEMARTPMEKTTRDMESLGNSTSLPAQEVLAKVAQMTSPPGSRIEVTPVLGKFVIQVAYRLSATTSGEAGARTKHHTVDSMRREVIDISSRITRDLYDYCGRRGIQKIVVSCNHAVKRIPGETPASERDRAFAKAPVVWSVFYRCTIPEAVARTVPNWRKQPLHKIEDMLVAEESLDNLTIRQTKYPGGPENDPAGALEF